MFDAHVISCVGVEIFVCFVVFQRVSMCFYVFLCVSTCFYVFDVCFVCIGASRRAHWSPLDWMQVQQASAQQKAALETQVGATRRWIFWISQLVFFISGDAVGDGVPAKTAVSTAIVHPGRGCEKHVV